MHEKVEKEKTGAAATGKEETRTQKKILDILGGDNNPVFFTSYD